MQRSFYRSFYMKIGIHLAAYSRVNLQHKGHSLMTSDFKGRGGWGSRMTPQNWTLKGKGGVENCRNLSDVNYGRSPKIKFRDLRFRLRIQIHIDH